ncbi:unnamed protein product [Thlaspi arvense]|uniref:Glycosyltransferase 2-like domain-containing protein n=1 Tax=Thlaspi arvense TaxID=13288 RepID=A0AAU9RYB5_THLAR|nr:unnamed protein product [Thlaspi arvense]
MLGLARGERRERESLLMVGRKNPNSTPIFEFIVSRNHASEHRLFSVVAKDTRQGTPVIVTMENPNYSVVEIDGPDVAFRPVDKERAKMRSNSHGSCFSRLTGVGFPRLARQFPLGTARHRQEKVNSRPRVWAMENEKSGKGKLLYRVILGFLVTALAFLAFEVVAHFNGWQLGDSGWLHGVYYIGWSFAQEIHAPLLQALSRFCVVLFLIQSADRLILCLGCFWIKYKKIKPQFSGIPLSLRIWRVQGMTILWFLSRFQCVMRERQVYEQSISAFLDDSDDESIQWLIRGEVSKWSQKGVNIIYRHRLVRTGYKAGNLKSAMNCDYDNPELGLVQARWAFCEQGRKSFNAPTKHNLCFHFEVEQQVNGVFLSFFGVWRIRALEESGGWLERTTVEDMDIAVRAHLNGWKFIFLNDVKFQNLMQLIRNSNTVHSGPMQLFRLCLPDIITSKISFWKKANLILLFFLLRKLVLPFYSFTLFCIILPLTMFVPKPRYLSVVCYVPVFMSFLSILPTPRSVPFIAHTFCLRTRCL